MVNIPMGLREGILVLGVVILTWLTLNFKRLIFRRIKKKRAQGKRTLDPYTTHIVGKILTAAIFFVSLMIILQVLGLDIVPLLTVSGIGAAILGFASKDVVANFFGGVMVYITRPFAVDDFIDVPGKTVMGTVEEIGWYHTTIRDLQKKLLYIPNAVFSTEVLHNYSRITHRRMEEKVRIRIADGDKANSIVEKLRKYLKEHPEIDQNQQIAVFIFSISPWGIVLDLNAYTKTTKYLTFLQIKQDVLLEVYKIAYE